MYKIKCVFAGALLSAALLSVGSADAAEHAVKAGDSLWKLSRHYNVSIEEIQKANNLSSDMILVGQKLQIPDAQTPQPQVSRSSFVDRETLAETQEQSASVAGEQSDPNNDNQITYIIQPGDTVAVIAKKFAVPIADVLKYNYLSENDIIYAGDKLWINDYAPRGNDQVANQSGEPDQFGQLVDWFTDGKHLLKAGNILTIIDLATRKQFKVKILGGSNHPDVEPLTSADTQVMRSLFPTWTWTPRPVIISFNGANIAGSLSGMPHGIDSVANNGVNGHFDMYLKNSQPHGSHVSRSYVRQHHESVQKAAGK